MTFWRRFLPGGIGSHLAALILVSVVALHLLVTIAFITLRPEEPGTGPGETTGRIEAVVRLLDAAAPAERTNLLALAQASFPDLALSLAATPPAAMPRPPGPAEPPFGGPFSRALAPRQVIPVAPGEAGIVLSDGSMLLAAAPRPSRGPPMGILYATLIFLVISITLIGTWSAKALAGPLRALAKAAATYNADGTPVALVERGPREIRAAAAALNQMQARITRLVADRTRMLAAVSHDLRTPITRLRLRAEFVKDDGERARMLADLAQMDELVQDALLYLRGGDTGEATALADLSSILATVADGFADLGEDVPYEGVTHVLVRARPHDLRRAVTNLVENALRHGGRTSVKLRLANPATALIDVEDDGPGIPDAEKAAMLEPFMRGDAARAMDEKGGFGLGLTIARSIVEAHQGSLTLLDRAPHGLVARIALPVAAAGP